MQIIAGRRLMIDSHCHKAHKATRSEVDMFISQWQWQCKDKGTGSFPLLLHLHQGTLVPYHDASPEKFDMSWPCTTTVIVTAGCAVSL